MTSIDQVPPPQPRDNPHDTPQGHPAGTEFVNNRGSQTFFGGENVPSYANVPQNRTDKDPDIDRKNKRGIKILGISVIAMVGVSAAAFFGTKAALSETHEGTRSTVDSSTEYNAALPPVDAFEPAQEVELTHDGLDKMSDQAFSELPDTIRLDYSVPTIENWRTDSYTILSEKLSDTQKKFFNNNFPSNKSDYTPQQIANQVAIDLYDASSQNGINEEGVDEGIDEGREEGKKMVSVVMSPDNPKFSDMISIAGGENAILAINEVLETYPRLKNVTFRNHTIGSEGAEIMMIESNGDGIKHFGLYQLISTPNGNSIWQFTDTFAYNDLTLQKDIAQAVSESHE